MTPLVSKTRSIFETGIASTGFIDGVYQGWSIWPFHLILKEFLAGDCSDPYEKYSYALEMFGRPKERRSFIVKQGYLGLDPQHMESEDLVIILLGADVPFISRPVHRTQWRLHMFRELGMANLLKLVLGLR